jgi:hypothetical protein
MANRNTMIVVLLGVAASSCATARRAPIDVNSISAIDYYSKLPECAYRVIPSESGMREDVLC